MEKWNGRKSGDLKEHRDRAESPLFIFKMLRSFFQVYWHLFRQILAIEKEQIRA